MIEELVFNPKDHTYELNERKVVSVTNAINSIFPKRPWFNDYYADKGTALHLACHYYVKGILDESTIDNRIQSKFDGFKKFLSDFTLLKKSIQETEYKVFNKHYNFAGTIDLIIEKFNTPNFTLADIKSSYDPIVLIQLAGYYLCIKEYKIDQAVVIILNDNGTYNLKYITKRELILNSNLFLSCLSLNNFKTKNNI